MVAVAAPCILFGEVVVRAWGGESVTSDAVGILTVLIVAGVIRLSFYPYYQRLIAGGFQAKLVISPIMEAIANIAASIVLGRAYGAIGVACGTLIGAVVGAVVFVAIGPTPSRPQASRKRPCTQ